MTGIDVTGQTVAMLGPGEGSYFLTAGTAPEVVFSIRERTAVTKYFGDTGIGVRAALFEEREIVLVAVAIRVGRYLKKEYVTWWDYHSPNGNVLFRLMTVQDFLPIFFYGDNGRRERSFIAANVLKEFFSIAAEKIPAFPPWDREAYNAASLTVRSRLSTPLDIWEAGQPK